MNRSVRAWVAVVLGLAVGACSDVAFEGGGPVSIKLTADRTAASVGQDVTFTFDAVGQILDGVTVEFGDGVADTLFAAGAQAAHGSFVHAYGSSGTFTAVGTAFDGRQGPATAQVVIRVTGG